MDFVHWVVWNFSFKKETIKLWEKFKAFLCEYDISWTLASGVFTVSIAIP